jgi:tetratricopeptide (TPR) repeat protein
MHRFDDASKALKEAVASAQNDAEWRDAVTLFAHVELFAERFEESLSYLKQVQEKQPDHPMTYFFMAVALVNTGDEEKASEYLETFRKYNFNYSQYLLDITKQFMSAKKYRLALSLLMFMRNNDVFESEAQALFAECDRKMKENETAETQ